jgi:hypothetical protein
MARDTQKPKADTPPKKEVAAKAESPAAKGASKDTPKPDTPKDAPKAESNDTAAAAPANYSRGEGQKPVTAAYRENWNVIFGKKKAKKKKR